MGPFYQEAMATIYCGNALEVLKSLPSESVQMAMTSPPYYGLRNYAGGTDIVWGGDENCEHEWNAVLKHRSAGGPQVPQSKWPSNISIAEAQRDTESNFCTLCRAWSGQLGLEPNVELYVSHLMMIFREVKRVLREDGSFYINIADTYAGSSSQGNQSQPQDYLRPYPQRVAMTPKCMICVPERLMLAMLDDGFILRNKIIWHKPNAMPSSAKDRFTASWEYLFFFVKARKYYFDLDAVRIPHTIESLERYQRGVNLGRPAIGKSGEVGPMQQYERAPEWFKEMFEPDADYKGKFDDLFGHGPNPQSFNLRVRDVKRGKGGVTAQGGELKASEKEVEEYEYPEKHHGSSMSNQDSLHRDRQKHESVGLRAQSPSRKRHSGHFGEDGQPLVDFAKGKNPGDFLELTTQPSSICVCPKCEAVFPRYIKVCPSCNIEGVVGHFAPYPVALCEMPIKASTKAGDVVLDPLAGGGNTGVAAKKLGRKCILIDCVKEYCIMARHKLSRIEYQPELRGVNYGEGKRKRATGIERA